MSSLFHPIPLPGGVTIPGNLFLAPLAGITDRGFRRICLEHKAPFTFTEMISGEALARGNRKTIALLERTEGEELLGVQIFLSEAEQAERALPVILEANPSLVDLNCGCPVPKITRLGAGSALMKSPKKIGEIVRVLSRDAPCPVTVKIRTGWDCNSINYLEAADAAIDAGAVMITLHGRSRSQGYSGKADWSHIRRLVQAAPVPIIGNGDAHSPEAARAMLEETGCAGVMFARGAMGNPFIFERTIRLLEKGDPEEAPGLETIMETALKQLSYTVADKGEVRACKEMRKQMAEYSKGLPGSAALRRKIVSCETEEEYRTVIREWLTDCYY
jgi:tRNA-dihydrouridine synthase B